MPRTPRKHESQLAIGFEDKNWIVETTSAPANFGKHEVIEIDFSLVQSPQSSDGPRPNWIAASPINAFLAFPMSGLSTEQESSIQQINQAIVQAVDQHVDPSFVWYDPSEDFNEGSVGPKEVYSNDSLRLAGSDVLLVNGFLGADGIGVLVQQASSLQIPTLIIYPENRCVTPFYMGMPTIPKLVSFTSIADIGDNVLNAIHHLLPLIRMRRDKNQIEDKLMREKRAGEKLCARRVASGRTLADVCDVTMLNPDFLYRLEMDPSAIRSESQQLISTILPHYGVDKLTLYNQGFAFQFDESSGTDSTVHDALSDLISYFAQERSRLPYCGRYDNALVNTWCGFEDEQFALKTRRLDSADDKSVKHDWAKRLQQQLLIIS